MADPCYRCAAQVPDQTPFCPECGAPQIRVTQRTADPDSSNPSSSETAHVVSFSSVSPMTGYAAKLGAIQWRKFLRIAWPLATVTGVVMSIRPGLGFVFLLPASIVWAIFRYRRIHTGQLGAAPGAKLGAAVGLLSFSLFIALVTVDIVNDSAEFKRLAVAEMQKIAAGNSDPQVQPFLQWATTSTGS